MTDEFDKEAEREKLREKYEADEADRSATQEMSELLLRGATMTNQHCERCGDPLFRENGETFCPTCRNAAGQQASQQAAQQRDAPEQEASGVPASDAAAAQNQPHHQQPTQGSVNPTHENSTPQTEAPAQLPENAEVVAQADDLRDERPQTPQTPRPQPTDTSTNAPDPSTELRKAVTETARKASAATDPRTARAWLEASKEAAEALAALEQ